MAEVRTKEQKRKAQAKRVGGEVSATHTFSYTAGKVTRPAKHTPDSQLVDTTLVPYMKHDLVKTTVVSLILFGLLVGISFFVRYN